MAEKSTSMANGPRLASRTVSSRRTARVAEKLQQKIRDKDYYEAHQTYRVLYQRYKAQGKETEALDLLYDGALLLIQHGQWSSGSDLGMLLVAHLKEQKTSVSDLWLGKIGTLFCEYGNCNTTPPNATPTTPLTSATSSTEAMDCSPIVATDGLFEVVPEVDSREGLLRAALKWSTMVAEGDKWKYGHPQLHKVAATAYWREKQYGKAREHFLYAEQPQEFGLMLVEVATTFGYTGEADLFITQVVLQLLVLKDRKGGLSVFNVYTRKHPRFKGDNPPYLHHPTLNFVWFLLSACKDRSREVFNCLMVNYAPTINRDPSFKEYLDKIGEAFFGVPNQPAPGRSAAAPGTSGIFGLGDAGGLIEGIMNTISNVLPGAVNIGSTGGLSASNNPPTQGSSQTIFTVPSGQTQHIHVGVPLNFPPSGVAPDGGSGGGVQIELPPVSIGMVDPQGVQIWPPVLPTTSREPPAPTTRSGPPPRINIHTRGGPLGRPPRVVIRQGQRPQHQYLPRGTNPLRPMNIQFNAPQSGNIRFGPPPPGAGHISVVGFRMEGVPVQVAGGAMPMAMGSGPVITPAQQQLYQQQMQQTGGSEGSQSSQQQQMGGSEGSQNSRQQQMGGSGGPQNSTQGDRWTPPPPPNDDMELD